MAYFHPAFRRYAPWRIPADGFRCLPRKWVFFLILCFAQLALGGGAWAAGDGSASTVKIQRGQASYLGKKFHGRQTANGEIYHEDKLTAAHKTLPFGTVLRVTRLSNGRAVLVRINDRGPFIEGRHVDLSLAAARELNMLRGGVTLVQYEVISTTSGKPLRRDEAFYLVFRTADTEKVALARADSVWKGVPDKLRKQLPKAGVFKRDQPTRQPGYFVGMGPFASFDEAHSVMFRIPAKQRPDIICARVKPGASVTAAK